MRLTAIFLLLFCSSLFAGGVRIVGQPGLPYPDIQEAVNAASPGDILVVGSGIYSGFSVHAKPLSIVAFPGAYVEIRGRVRYFYLPKGQSSLLEGLTILGMDQLTGNSATLDLDTCRGHLRIENCFVRGGDGRPSDSFGQGAPAVRADRCKRVVFAGCTLVGGDGYDQGPSSGYRGAEGGGAVVGDKLLSFYDCEIYGGQGGNSGTVGGDGGHGVEILEGTALLTGCTIRGGLGAFAVGPSPFKGGRGGSGVVCQGGDAVVCSSDVFGAPIGGTDPGDPKPGFSYLEIGGVVIDRGLVARSASAQTVCVDGETILVEFHGPANGRVRLHRSATPDFKRAGDRGVRLLEWPAVVAPEDTLVLDGQGFGVMPVRVAGHDLPLFLQPVFEDGADLRYGTPLHLVILDRTGLRDCNGNGTSDLVDLIEGTSLDVNEDLRPDDCLSAAVYYVEDGAPAGGDGSPAAPFRNFAEAITASSDGDTLIIRDGTYTGANNVDLALGGKNLTIRSENGNANCTIDCLTQGRAFDLTAGETQVVIEGLTIRNGRKWGLYGGGILAEAGTTIRDCRFLDCEANNGGGVYLFGSGVIENCIFRRCDGHTGGALRVDIPFTAPADSYVRLTGLTITGSSGTRGGAMAVTADFGRVDLSHSRFEDNIGYDQGGALYAEFYVSDGQAERLSVSQCLFSGNRGNTGGAAYFKNLEGRVRVAGCTFGENDSTTFVDRPTLVFEAYGNGHPVEVTNSILWNTDLAQEIWTVGGVDLLVDACDVRGGANGIVPDASTVLTYGSGNINSNPLLAPVTLELDPNSPCIDAGDVTLLPADFTDIDGDMDTLETVELDLERAPRRVDLPGTPDTGTGPAPIVDMGALEVQ